MTAYRVTRKAQADLIEIGRYTTKEWGVTQRNTYLKDLDNCFSQIARNPELGVDCDYIADGYRKFPQGSHLVFYRQGNEGIVEIIRVLHKAVDVVAKFE
jgi:toxin ParE1/3/4